MDVNTIFTNIKSVIENLYKKIEDWERELEGINQNVKEYQDKIKNQN